MLDLELTALGAEVKKRKAEGRLSQTGQLPCLVVRPGLEINEALAIGRYLGERLGAPTAADGPEAQAKALAVAACNCMTDKECAPTYFAPWKVVTNAIGGDSGDVRSKLKMLEMLVLEPRQGAAPDAVWWCDYFALYVCEWMLASRGSGVLDATPRLAAFVEKMKKRPGVQQHAAVRSRRITGSLIEPLSWLIVRGLFPVTLPLRKLARAMWLILALVFYAGHKAVTGGIPGTLRTPAH